MFRNPSYSRTGFTLVELIVGMTVFAIGLTGIYALLSWTIGNSTYSRHEVVVANLLREQIELIKNVRDTNIRNLLPWDTVFIEWLSTSRFSSWVYVIENDFSHEYISIDTTHGTIQNSPIYIKDITVPFMSSSSIEQKFARSALYLDAEWRYTHAVTKEGTPYASYTLVYPITINTNPIMEIKKDGKPQWYIVDARVIVNSRWVYREYDAKTAITDWIR